MSEHDGGGKNARADRKDTVVIAGHVHEDIACEFFALLGKLRMTRKAAVHIMIAGFLDDHHHPAPTRLAADIDKLRSRLRRKQR